MNKRIYDKLLAAQGLKSYRAKGRYGYIMIGARDDEDAYREALRSSPDVKRDDLEAWSGTVYLPVLWQRQEV